MIICKPMYQWCIIFAHNLMHKMESFLMVDTNKAFKNIIREKGLSPAFVLECFSTGGVEVSRSRMNAYQRSGDDRRAAVMPGEHFEAFKRGLALLGGENGHS